MTRMRDLFLRQLLVSGIDTIFGNPGTTEMPLMDALVDHPEVRYILALHDSGAVGMAHGYALSSGRPAAVNLHTVPGVHNALGNLYNAYKSGAPILVTAGQVDTRLLPFESPLGGDMVNVVRGCTKWAYEVQRPEHLIPAVRRAVKVALTPPTGPVFLSLPMDVLDAPAGDTAGRMSGGPGGHPADHPAGHSVGESADRFLAPPRVACGRLPDEAVLERFAALIVEAERPIIVAGDALAKGGAVPELVRLSEAAALPVYAERVPSLMVFPTDHPHFQGSIGFSGAEIGRALAATDLVVLAGAGRLVPVLPSDEWRLPAGTRLVHLDADPWEVGKNFPTELAIVADIGATLAAVTSRVERLKETSGAFGARVAARRSELAESNRARTEALQRELAAVWDQRPIAVPRLVAELRRLLPDDAIVVDESLTSARQLHRHFPFRRPGTFYGIKGTALGLALPAAIGVKLAHPERTVLCFLGDGSSLYSIQALWTAAHYDVDIAVVISNNASYRILKEGLRGYRGPQGEGRPYPAMDLERPRIDFVALSRSLGVRAVRVTEPAELRDALQNALSGGPALVDVEVDPGRF